MQDFLLDEINQAIIPKSPDKKLLGIIAIGGTGSGKTTLIGTAPKPLILNFDHGLTTLDSMGLTEGTDYVAINFQKSTYKEMTVPGGTKRVERSPANIEKCTQLLAYAADRSGPFAEGGPLTDIQTIAVDGFTSMSDYFLYEIMTNNLKLDYLKDKGGYDGYGQLKKALNGVAEKLIQCKEYYNIIGTALVGEQKRPGSMSENDNVFVPLIDGSFRDMIGKTLDEFIYLETKVEGAKTKHYVHTSPTYTVPCLRSRSKLPARMEGVTFPEIKQTFLDSHQKGKESRGVQ